MECLRELDDDLFAPLRPDEGVFAAFELQEPRKLCRDADHERIAGLGNRDLFGKSPEPKFLGSCFDLPHRFLIDE